MNLELLIKQISDVVVGWPLMIFVIIISIICSLLLLLTQKLRERIITVKEKLMP